MKDTGTVKLGQASENIQPKPGDEFTCIITDHENRKRIVFDGVVDEGGTLRAKADDPKKEK